VYTILLVCTGNTCRSPMAQALLREILARRGVEARVLSAGIAASAGGSASPEAVQVMQEHGLDLSGHSTTPLTVALIDEADVILTMSERHKEAVRAMKPQAIEKTFCLTEFVGETGDVEDPFGRDVEAYRKTAELLRALLEKAADRLPLSGQGNGVNA